MRRFSKVTGSIVLLFGLLLTAASVGAGGLPVNQGTEDWSPDRQVEELELRGVERVDWATAFGSSNTDWFNRVIRRSDGSLAAVGFVDRAEMMMHGPAEWDGIAHRFDADGAPIWTKRFRQPGLHALWSVVATPGERLAAAGFTDAQTAGSTDAWLLLLDGDGVAARDARVGGTGAERATDIVAATDGGFLLVGQTQQPGRERDVWLARVDGDGDTVWTRSYGGADIDRGFYGVATADGGFVVAGVTGVDGDYDLLAMKVDAGGNEVWRQVVGGPGNDPNHGINLLPDGRVVVVGYTASWEAEVHDLIAVTLSPDGEVLRREVLGGPGDDRVMSSITAADGGSWLVGYTTSFGNGDWDVLLARLTPEGRFEPWLGAIGTQHDDHGTSVVELEDGSLVLAGYTTAASNGADADLLLFRLGPGDVERRTRGISARAVR